MKAHEKIAALQANGYTDEDIESLPRWACEDDPEDGDSHDKPS